MSRTAIIGAGTIGSATAKHLASEGHDVVVWNRTQTRLSPLAAAGIDVTATSRLAVKGADIIALFLADDAAVRSVMDSGEGIARHLMPTAVVLDLSTTSPKTKHFGATLVAERGSAFLDSPFFGSEQQAENGTLLPLLGGSTDAIERARPFLDAISERQFHVGPVGTATTMKLAGNLLVFAMITGLAEALSLVEAAGANPDAFMSVVRATGFHSKYIDQKSQQMISRDYAPRFSVANAAKDVNLIRDAAAELGQELRSLTAASALLDAAYAQELGNEDIAAIREAARPSLVNRFGDQAGETQ